MKASLTFLALIVSSVVCWHGNGHYTVAYIAQSYLQNKDPKALDWANSILQPFTEECGENLYPFVESATWADKIRDAGWNLLFYHHFISLAWFDQGARPYTYDNSTYANVLFAINDSTSLLSSVQEDPFGSSKSILGKSISLRNLIHYLGDIHQPLHASERVTPKLPKGDEGGNLFEIDHYHKNKSIDNLHFIWDHMFGALDGDIRTNLNQQQYQVIKNLGEQIMQEYSFSDLQKQMMANDSPPSWAKESNDLAQNFVYKGLVEGQDLPTEYMQKGYQICRERVALAGYRLGVLLSRIYQTQKTARHDKSQKEIISEI